MTDVDTIARQLAALEATAAEVAAAIAEKKAHLLAALTVGDVVNLDGEPAYKIQPGARRFNLSKANQVCPAEMLQAATVTTTTVDSKRLKQLLPPAVWDAVCVQGDPYVKAVR